MKRRRFLAGAAGATGFALAGCITGLPGDGTGSLDGTLTVATYGSFVDAPSSSPGPWIQEEFERRHPDVSLEWAVPENGLNHFIEGRQSGVDLDADVYVGLKIPELVRADRVLSEPLFAPVDVEQVDNVERVKPEYTFDPSNRVLPLFTGYCCLVYDGYEADPPETLDALTSPAYEGRVAVQNPMRDNTGLYFLLWTIHEKGEDGYLEYWEELLENDVRILDDWSTAYSAFSSGDVQLVTSFSNDQVYAKRADEDLEKHQVAFPGGHGYTNLSGIGKFATSEQPALVRSFVDFMLGPEAQGKLAELNVSFPVTDHADVPEVFDEYAKEPPEPIYYTYDDLRGRVDNWTDEWSRSIAEQ